MNTNTIIKHLNGYNSIDVGNFISYLNKLQNEKKDGRPVNYWITDNLVTDEQLAEAFAKVYSQNLVLDGEIITLSYRKKLTIDYSYHAYRKKLTATYPETVIDAQVVFKEDKFSFTKESGKVIYSHDFGNPFDQKSGDIVGAYCIVKNRAGEFIELISKEDAEKMKQIARTKTVWNTWPDRMYLKSAIKRLCKTFFHDAFNEIEELDNENYSFDLMGVPEEKQAESNKRAEIRHKVKVLSSNLAKYNGSDKMALKAIYLKAHKEGTVTMELVQELNNRIEYGILLESYTGEDKDLILESYKQDQSITDEALNSLKVAING